MKLFAICVLLLSLTGCGTAPEMNDETSGNSTPEVLKKKDVHGYLTTADRSRDFEEFYLDFSDKAVAGKVITYDPADLLNEVDGFGFAITTAVGYNLQKMKPAERHAFLESMFSVEKGIGSSLIRVAIGASDFCISDEYTWCDEAGLENFKVHEEDARYLIPILKEIYEINPAVKIIASPWSCPQWMKGKHSETDDPAVMEEDCPQWRSGRLKPSCYQVYADYFVRWIQVMEKEGFDIYALTMQNEPLNHGNSMSMYMPWKDQKAFIKVLGPTLKAAGIDSKILLYDHNYDYSDDPGQQEYPNRIFADSEASRWAAGSAWHSYGGSVNELDNIVSAFPDKEIYFTEASIGEWNYDKGNVVGGNFDRCFMNEFDNIFIGTLKRGGRGVTYWNLMLDEKNSPHSRHGGACKTCYGGVTISSKDYSKITRNSHWYDVAHASSVIRPGARRLNTVIGPCKGVQQIMYLNPDQSIGVIILNKNDRTEELTFTTSSSDKKVTCSLPAKSVTSLDWKL